MSRDRDLRRRPVKMARFRNLLVHLGEDLVDFDADLAAVGQYLDADLG